MELNYIRCGDYYIPDIRLPEENRPVGRWGRMRRDDIKEHNPIRFNDLCLSGELQELICRNEEKLKATMTDEQKELFGKYNDCVREYQTITDCLIFQNSFKLGARMMVEVMAE